MVSGPETIFDRLNVPERSVGAHRYLGPPNLPSGIAGFKRASRIVADEEAPS
jgi:hypothetical protein